MGIKTLLAINNYKSHTQNHPSLQIDPHNTCETTYCIHHTLSK